MIFDSHVTSLSQKGSSCVDFHVAIRKVYRAMQNMIDISNAEELQTHHIGEQFCHNVLSYLTDFPLTAGRIHC